MKKLIIVLLIIILVPLAATQSLAQQDKKFKYEYFISYALYTQLNASGPSSGLMINVTYGNIVVYFEKKIVGNDIMYLQTEIQKRYPDRQVIIIFIKELEK